MGLYYDFSTLYTTLHHSLIKDKLIDLIERTLLKVPSRGKALITLRVMTEMHFYFEKPKTFHALSCL